MCRNVLKADALAEALVHSVIEDAFEAGNSDAVEPIQLLHLIRGQRTERMSALLWIRIGHVDETAIGTRCTTQSLACGKGSRDGDVLVSSDEGGQTSAVSGHPLVLQTAEPRAPLLHKEGVYRGLASLIEAIAISLSNVPTVLLDF